MSATTQKRPEALLTLQQVAGWLGVSKATLYAWRYQGDGPPGYRLHGGGVRYRRADVEQWLDEQRDPASDPLSR